MIDIELDMSEPVVQLDIELTMPPADAVVPIAIYGAFDLVDVPFDEVDWAFDE